MLCREERDEFPKLLVRDQVDTTQIFTDWQAGAFPITSGSFYKQSIKTSDKPSIQRNSALGWQMAMPNSGSRLQPTPRSQTVVFSLLLLPRCYVFLLLYDNFPVESVKLQEKSMVDTKELGGNLTSSKFLLLLGLVHFSSSAYRYVTFGFIRQQMVIKQHYSKPKF